MDLTAEPVTNIEVRGPELLFLGIPLFRGQQRPAPCWQLSRHRSVTKSKANLICDLPRQGRQLDKSRLKIFRSTLLLGSPTCPSERVFVSQVLGIFPVIGMYMYGYGTDDWSLVKRSAVLLLPLQSPGSPSLSSTPDLIGHSLGAQFIWYRSVPSSVCNPEGGHSGV